MLFRLRLEQLVLEQILRLRLVLQVRHLHQVVQHTDDLYLRLRVVLRKYLERPVLALLRHLRVEVLLLFHL